MGYYGPNKDILGDIGSSYWQFKAIEDIGRMVQLLAAFFVVDSVSLLVSAYLVWTFCEVNLYQGYVVLKREFGWVFAASFSIQLTMRFLGNMVNFASDMTFQFDWKDGYFNYSEPTPALMN